jgi:DNA (cytosine-5)-methyltransferase 1
MNLILTSVAKRKTYKLPMAHSDCVSDVFISLEFPFISEDAYNSPLNETNNKNEHRLLSLFSGCGGMDLGFEGKFIANRKSFNEKDDRIEKVIDKDWILLKKNHFRTVFANDILPEAAIAWTTYMRRFGYDPSIFHTESIVDLVKLHKEGVKIFPDNVEIVLGGFPCQDFSVAGKRLGFDSKKDDKGQLRTADVPSEESRGKLYFWMKEVIDIVKPKIFVAENVKGLVNLGNVKDIIQHDFASADGNGYIVLPPQVLHAGNYGVPESRERVIFIGVRRNALNTKALKALESDVIPEEYNPYPKPTHAASIHDKNLLPIVTTHDVLKNLREPEFTQDESQKVYSKAKYLDNGSQGQIEIKLDGLGPTIRSEHHGNIEFRRLSAEHGGKHFEELKQGLKERRLTPRECAMIQTFPPDYQFITNGEYWGDKHISASGAYKIIGNAVPPVMAYQIATRLQDLWSKYFE